MTRFEICRMDGDIIRVDWPVTDISANLSTLEDLIVWLREHVWKDSTKKPLHQYHGFH